MEWGYTVRGDRKHILAECVPWASHNAGISLCGIVLRFRFVCPEYSVSWVTCQRCKTLLSAMESV